MFPQLLPPSHTVLAVGFVLTRIIIMALIFEPKLKILWYWAALSEDKTHVVTDLIHQLLVSGHHHLGAGHVDGIRPVPAAFHQVCQAEKLCLNYGVVTPVYWHTLRRGLDIRTRESISITFHQILHSFPVKLSKK